MQSRDPRVVEGKVSPTPTAQDDSKIISDFVALMEKSNPTIPDEVIEYFLKRNGFQESDPAVIRIIAVAAERFISEIAQKAMDSKDRDMSDKKGKGNTLDMDSLLQALSEKGLQVHKAPYWIDPPS